MIRAVERALAIFDAFDAQRQSLTLQEIGERIGMPKATTFRLVNTLLNSGFLVRLENQQYCLSLKILRLSGLVKSTIGIRDTARPIMAELAQQTAETVTLNMRSGHERICIEVIETPSPLMSIVRPGEHVSLLCGATALALLAYCSESELAEVIAAAKANQRINEPALRRELAAIRESGFARTSGQRIVGVTAVAAPIFDIDDEVRYAIAVTGPSVRIDPLAPKLEILLPKAAAEISQALGASAAKLAPRGQVLRRRRPDSDGAKRTAPARS